MQPATGLLQVTFIRGTVPLHGVVENAGKSDTRGEILDRSVLPDGRHIFHQTLRPGRRWAAFGDRPYRCRWLYTCYRLLI